MRTPAVRERARQRAKKRYWSDHEFRERDKRRRREQSKSEHGRALQRAFAKRQWATNPTHRVRSTLHKAIRRALIGVGKKNAHLQEIVGCDLPALMKHIESLFRPGMTWENRGSHLGEWQLDHVYPISSFDLTNPEEVKKCFHYTNLQPLWMEDNLRKRAKMPHEVGPDLLPMRLSQ